MAVCIPSGDRSTDYPGNMLTQMFDIDYPSYELFTETLREGAFRPALPSASIPDWEGRQLRLVVDRNRKVQKVIEI